MSRSWIAFIATGKQDHQRPAAAHEVNPITGPEVYSQFRDTLTDWLHIAEIAERQSSNTNIDTCTNLPITQAIKPSGKNLGLPYFDHLLFVSYKIHYCKENLPECQHLVLRDANWKCSSK